MRVLLMTILMCFSVSTFAQSSTKTQTESIDLDDVEFEEAFEQNQIDSSEFALGVNLGRRTFTGGIGELSQDGLLIGFSALYNFSSLFAIEGSFSNSDHNIDISNFDTGSMTFRSQTLKGRYYPHFSSMPYNILPYLTAGLSYNQITYSITNRTPQSRINKVGQEIGIGSKFLFLNDQAYFDIQLAYKIINFGNSEFNINQTTNSVRNEGDEISLISGITFII